MMTDTDRAMWEKYWIARKSLEIHLKCPSPDAKVTQALENAKGICREIIIRRYLPTSHPEVTAITNFRAFPGNLELWDVISCIYTAIISRMDAFDGRSKFETFIQCRARGAVYDELRSRGFTPRGQIRAAKSKMTAECTFYGENGRNPTAKEMEDISPETKDVAPNISVYSMHVPLKHRNEEHADFRDIVFDPAKCDSPPGDENNSREELLNALTRDPIDQQILRGYYFDNLTMREIAALVNLSESRVSQLHTNLMHRLRASPRAEKLLYSHVEAI